MSLNDLLKEYNADSILDEKVEETKCEWSKVRHLRFSEIVKGAADPCVCCKVTCNICCENACCDKIWDVCCAKCCNCCYQKCCDSDLLCWKNYNVCCNDCLNICSDVCGC